MNYIGLIDDRDSQRRNIKTAIEHSLETLHPSWRIQDSKPFPDIDEYRQWILEQGISVLVIDERLNEEKALNGKEVDYLGHNVISYLRTYLKDYPIFVLTNYGADEELEKSIHEYSLVINKDQIESETDKYANLIVKSGEIFYNQNKKQLERLSFLANKISTGQATKEDKDEALGIQYNLALPHVNDSIIQREKYLGELEESTNKLIALKEQIQNFLDKKK